MPRFRGRQRGAVPASEVSEAPEREIWCRREDSNPGPAAYDAAALPTELQRQGTGVGPKSGCPASASCHPRVLAAPGLVTGPRLQTQKRRALPCPGAVPVFVVGRAPLASLHPCRGRPSPGRRIEFPAQRPGLAAAGAPDLFNGGHGSIRTVTPPLQFSGPVETWRRCPPHLAGGPLRDPGAHHGKPMSKLDAGECLLRMATVRPVFVLLLDPDCSGPHHWRRPPCSAASNARGRNLCRVSQPGWARSLPLAPCSPARGTLRRRGHVVRTGRGPHLFPPAGRIVPTDIPRLGVMVRTSRRKLVTCEVGARPADRIHHLGRGPCGPYLHDAPRSRGVFCGLADGFSPPPPNGKSHRADRYGADRSAHSGEMLRRQASKATLSRAVEPKPT